MPIVNTAEKIETIVMCYLARRTTKGTMGSLVDVPAFTETAGDGHSTVSCRQCYRVTADGKTFIVRAGVHAWEVRFGPFVGIDPDLYVAAKMVCDETAGGKVSELAAVLS